MRDALALYGFATPLELAVFDRLVGISGVGPKLALAVLSGIEPHDLVRAIEQGDVARLTSIPGVGRKTSERIVMELKDRLPRLRPEVPVASGSAPLSALRDDVLSALVNLGYHRPLSEKAVDAAVKAVPDGSFERTLKHALAGTCPVTDSSRIVTTARVDEDVQYEAGLRPRILDDYVGQDRIRENLQVAIAAAKHREEPLDHVLLHGPPGLGKTTLAYVIANEMGVQVRATSGPAIEKPGDLVGIVTNLAAGEILFIDEIHRMSPAVEEILYPALEDYQVDIVIGQGPSARDSQDAPRALHAHRGNDPNRAADLTAPIAIRHRPPAGILRQRRSRGNHPPLGQDSQRARYRTPLRWKSLGAPAARRASRTAYSGASVIMPKCAPRAP